MTRNDFQKFLEENEKDIYKFCYHLTGNKENADDLYQDTWVAVIPKLMKIESDKNPKSYVLGQIVMS